jgi:hypothetical protein
MIQRHGTVVYAWGKIPTCICTLPGRFEAEKSDRRRGGCMIVMDNPVA